MWCILKGRKVNSQKDEKDFTMALYSLISLRC